MGDFSSSDTKSCSQQTDLHSDNMIVADVTSLSYYNNDSDIPRVTAGDFHLLAVGESVG